MILSERIYTTKPSTRLDLNFFDMLMNVCTHVLRARVIAVCWTSARVLQFY